MTLMNILMELTTDDGQTVFVNPAHVRSVTGSAKGSVMVFSEGDTLKVKQRPEVVTGKIDRWLTLAYFGRYELARVENRRERE